MTLREMREAHPGRFYPQVWFEGEAFMDIAAGMPLNRPRGSGPHIAPPTSCKRAVDVAAYYLRAPNDPVFKHYIWTADLDHLGQRVYLGDNGKGLEIHRHLQITDRWRAPLW